MSIMDMFRNAVAPTANIPAPAPAPVTTVTTTSEQAPVTQEQAQVLPVTQEPETPLAQFKDMWETKPIEKDDQTQQTEPVALNQEAVQKIVAKTDFSQVITPENMAAITAGGEDASKAFASAMNQVAQQVMVQATMVNNKLTEQAVAKAREDFSSSLPALLRQQASANHLNETNPLFSNPAVKPVIEATQAQLLSRHPNATHAEITKMTQDYIIAMGTEFAPKDAVNNTVTGDTDWETFLKT